MEWNGHLWPKNVFVTPSDRYKREIVITEFVKTEFHCTNKNVIDVIEVDQSFWRNLIVFLAIKRINTFDRNFFWKTSIEKVKAILLKNKWRKKNVLCQSPTSLENVNFDSVGNPEIEIYSLKSQNYSYISWWWMRYHLNSNCNNTVVWSTLW